MSGPKQRKKLKGVELARKRQPTGKLLSDVWKKSKTETNITKQKHDSGDT